MIRASPILNERFHDNDNIDEIQQQEVVVHTLLDRGSKKVFRAQKVHCLVIELCKLIAGIADYKMQCSYLGCVLLPTLVGVNTGALTCTCTRSSMSSANDSLGNF